MEILIATENRHKVEELTAIFREHELLTPGDAGIDYSHEETGTTFLENSMGKARSLFALAGGRPVVADDSGLVVPALNGEPGIYSARYGSGATGRKLDTPQRNQYLLDRMRDISDRRAFFVCSMIMILSDYRFFVIQETLAGEIAREPSGTNGFGYDPLFFLSEYGKTVAELPEELKNRISHRGLAARRIETILETLQ